MQEMKAASIVDGNGTEIRHIIVTTIGGKNGQLMQVCPCLASLILSRFETTKFVDSSPH
jgi:hypothetical protein